MVLGAKNLKEAISKRKIRAVLIPNDTSKTTLNPLLGLLKRNPETQVIYADFSKEELSDSVGKNTSVIGIKNEDMINELRRLMRQEHEEECVICQKNTEYTK